MNPASSNLISCQILSLQNIQNIFLTHLDSSDLKWFWPFKKADFLIGAFSMWWKKLPYCWCAFASAYFIPSAKFCHSKGKVLQLQTQTYPERQTQTKLNSCSADLGLSILQLHHKYLWRAGNSTPRSRERKLLLGWTEVCIRRNVPSCQEKRRFIVLGKIIDIFKNRLQKYCDSSGRYRIFVAIPCISGPEIGVEIQLLTIQIP